MSVQPRPHPDESPESLRNRLQDYERRFRFLDDQMRVLERERQKLSAVVNHTDAGFLVVNDSLEVIWANNIFAARFGGTTHPGSILGATCNRVLCRREAICDTCPAAQPFKTGTVAHHEMRLEVHGQPRYIYATAMPIKSLTGTTEQTIIMLQDVSNLEVLRRSREALQASEERFRSIFEKAAMGMATVAGDGSFRQVNPALCRFLGYAESELTKMKVFDVIHPDDLEASRRVFSELHAQPGPAVELEKRYLRKDGATVWGFTTAAWLFDTRQTPSHLVALIQDIGERRRAEEALRQSEVRKGAILDTAQDAIITIDHQGVVTEFNPAAETTFGYSRAEALGRSMADLIVPPSLRERHHQGFAAYLRTGESRILGRRIELTAMRRDGSEFPAEIAITRIPLPGPAAFTGYVRDLSERKRAEEALRQSEAQLRQSQKMEAVGRLAGGVAHDFNNLLTVITGRSQLLLRRLGADAALRQELEVIRSAGERAASLTRQLLAFSRKQVLQPKVLDLNAVVADMDKILRRLIGEDIELMTVLAPGLGSVKADPGQIEQVIMNLAVNARDAMPGGGRLSIETREVDLPEAPDPRGPGRYVMLALSDNGCGMDAETASHVFEPFFTTKSQGTGTGLGLSTSYGIIRQSGGLIRVESAPGRGATFRIYLPIVAGGAKTAAAETEVEVAGAVANRGTETVLLVEDEEVVRELAREVLEMNGYTVLETRDVEDAQRICSRHGGAIHLMLTDVVMPQMSGRELAERLAPLRPDMRVLYMSGYTDDAIVLRGVLESGTAFLQKPFSPDDLAAKVREVLDGSGPG
jgi:PAS domain S-box-containing protein